jgi:hypothetical protein
MTSAARIQAIQKANGRALREQIQMVFPFVVCHLSFEFSLRAASGPHKM